MTVSADAMSVANEQGFQRRVKHFMTKAAIAVMAELLSTEHHTERAAYANLVLSGAASVYEYSVAVMTNATMQAGGLNADDSDMEFTVNSMFTAMAGGETGSA